MDTFKSCYQTWAEFPQPRKIKIIKIAAFVCYAFFLLFVVIYGFGGTGKSSKTITPTVVFMEAMPTSLEALRYLAQRRDFSIAMIVLTVDGWVSNMEAAYENVASFLRVLKQEGYSATVPVYYGSSFASSDSASFSKIFFVAGVPIPVTTTTCSYRRVLSDTLTTNAQRVFGADNLLNLVSLSGLEARPTYFLEPLYTYLGKTTANFLVLGPGTDAALFLQTYASRRSRVQRVVIAGGAFSGVAGDTRYIYASNLYSEVNFFMDPQAANYLVQATHGRPTTLVTLNGAFSWDSAAYETLVTSRVSTSAASEAQVTSGAVVGTALNGFYSQVGSSSKPMSVSMIAAALLADSYLQNGAVVSNIPVTVYNNDGLSSDGTSIRPPSGPRNIDVVTGINTNMMTTHMLRVDGLPLS